jgi:thiosulfate/3-mercaptopyruvate sulfurtransferase
VTAETPPLVSTEWLAEHLGDPDVRVLDCRWYLKPFDSRDGRDEYEAGHVPGATHVRWDRELADPDRGALNMLADPVRFAEAMSLLGVDRNTFVVTYDDHHVPVAARVWWALRTHGHRSAAVLDGGIISWVAEGRPLATGRGTHPPTSRFESRFDGSIYATKQDVLDALGSGSAQLVDARMDPAYEAASGHIPGATRVTGLGFLGADRHWIDGDACLRRILAAGIDPDRPTILYCGGGVAATGAFLGWTRAGLGDRVRVYDGSWGEWERDPGTPKEPNR